VLTDSFAVESLDHGEACTLAHAHLVSAQPSFPEGVLAVGHDEAEACPGPGLNLVLAHQVGRNIIEDAHQGWCFGHGRVCVEHSLERAPEWIEMVIVRALSQLLGGYR